LVAVPGMFLQHRFHLVVRRGVLLLKDLLSDCTGEHMAGDVPSRSGRRQYSKNEKYEGWG
jgi:hypothetical protein